MGFLAGHLETSWPYLFGLAPGIAAFVLAWTCLSSTRHRYEQQLTKRFGVKIEGTVTDKRIESFTTREKRANNWIELEHHDHFIEYRYSFGREYTGAFCLESDAADTLFEQIEIGSGVPLRILSFAPELSHVRFEALVKALQKKPT